MQKSNHFIVTKSLILITVLVGVFFNSNQALAIMSDCQDPATIILDHNTSIKFCSIPAAYGIAIGSEDGDADEKPVKKRYFAKSFQMGQFEVTQAQYKAVMHEEPWLYGQAKVRYGVIAADKNPAVFVTYWQAKKFAAALSALDQTATYRLPTEAEWEYAARAGTESKYYWGDEFSTSYAFYYESFQSGLFPAKAVDSCPNMAINDNIPGYCANQFGLMHMSGNVWEYTADNYNDSYADAFNDGQKPYQNGTENIVVRGGGWLSINSRPDLDCLVGKYSLFDKRRYIYTPGNYIVQCLSSSNRYPAKRNARSSNLGFRLVRMPK